MECFVDAHYFPLPTQGNIYSVVNLQQSNGKNKTLVATLKRKIYSCEFIDENNILLPVIKEVPFTYIPTGAEIISIDAFNRSKTCDDFFIGITIIKAVWLLSGSDLKMHLFREDPQNHTYCEIEAEDIFPEFSRLPSIVFWVDIKHTSDKERRLTAFGCECGLVKIFMVDITKNVLLLNISNQFDAPVSRVSLFTVKTEPVYTKSSVLGRLKEKNDALNDGKSHRYNLLVINTLQPSVVFMDVVDGEFENRIILPDSDKYDIALCACIADVNMDTTKEILIGTFAKELLVYKYENAVWILQGQHKFSHSVHSINYVDITGDGVKELIVVTMLGVQIFQHNLLAVMDKIKLRLGHITMSEDHR
ncbi:KICSTOR complex protein kaptin isoform X2 [Halyomorpha halys]|uniref:KICSTOR complex protein kaptin isoform X2 n=1 Tax=Halyomorpha halys TaxID=286706 RepID=UPI0034D22F0A